MKAQSKEDKKTNRETKFNSFCCTVTSANLKNAGMASRNIVIKNNIRYFKSALQ